MDGETRAKLTELEAAMAEQNEALAEMQKLSAERSVDHENSLLRQALATSQENFVKLKREQDSTLAAIKVFLDQGLGRLESMILNVNSKIENVRSSADLVRSTIKSESETMVRTLAANLPPVVKAFSEDMEKVRIEQAKIADRRALIDIVVCVAAFFALFLTINSVTDWTVSTWFHNAFVWIGQLFHPPGRLIRGR